jgi:hypothetical protein
MSRIQQIRKDYQRLTHTSLAKLGLQWKLPCSPPVESATVAFLSHDYKKF